MEDTLENLEAELDGQVSDTPLPPHIGGAISGEPGAPDRGSAEDQLDAEAMGSLVRALTKYVANAAGPQWEASDEEARQIAECANKVMVKYAPMVSKYQEEGALAMVLVAYLLPRLKVALPAPPRQVQAVQDTGEDQTAREGDAEVTGPGAEGG